eukprot:Skav205419  [mRNA]  locus=scaffold582:198966:212485:- [translate_table: standard]
MPNDPISKPCAHAVKIARNGDYNPEHEVTTFNGKHKLKQYRRLQSLHRQLLAHADDDADKWRRSQPHLRQEWFTILRATAFGGPFSEWLSTHPDIGPARFPLPSPEWLFFVMQLVKFEVDASLAADRAFQLQLQQAEQCADQKMGSRRNFQYIKTGTKPPVTELLTTFDQTCEPLWDTHHAQVTLPIPPEAIDVGTPIFVDDVSGWIMGTSEHTITVWFQEFPKTQPSTVQIKQQRLLQEPQQIVEQLNQFWLPIWDSDHVPTAQQIQDFEGLLDNLPANLTPLDIHMDDHLWVEAIRRLKGATAKGFDAISGWELKTLPLRMIQKLAETILMYSTGLPAWYMKARTCPISKTCNTPNATQIRPITVLPILYRVYSSVVCRQILKTWHLTYPGEIKGLLPTRGAHDAAYHGQLLLELSRDLKQEITGLTLDITKCFNYIWHHVGPKLLRAQGIPEHVITRWQGSITAMTRYWEVQSGSFGPFKVTRGYPEGDSHSVLIMLSIAWLWVESIRLQESGQQEISSYADNWTYMVREATLHEPILSKTIQVTELCGLSIDWDKTWVFATTTKGAQRAKQAISQVLTESQVKRVHHAKDLGLEMTYSGTHRVGHVVDRHEQAMKRLKRLQHLAADSIEKEKLWMVGILPLCFHGAEVCPPSQSVIKTVRSHAADAIFGVSSSMSPSIALLLGKRHILDPEYQLIIRALAAARRWLAVATPAHQKQFYRMAAEFRGGIQKVKGPASALSLYLSVLDWTIDRQGYILCHAFHRLHLLEDSFPRIKWWLELAWQHGLLLRLTERTHLYSSPDISRADTISLLNKFGPSDRGQLVREIAGAFQTQHQKQQWDPTAQETCRFCNEPDSRYHRIFECAAFSDVRQPYLHHLAWLEEQGHEPAELPVIHVHEHFDAHLLMHYHDVAPVIGHEFLQLAEDRAQANRKLCLYTDGSCRYPEAPTTRFAGFSVVVDLCDNDEQRKQFASAFQATGQMPESLQTLAMARTVGEQNIHRAELSALAVAAQLPGQLDIRADSQSALTMIHNLQKGTFAYLTAPNTDLAAELTLNLQPDKRFIKIQAHQKPEEQESLIELYHILGNIAADTAAKAAIEPQSHDFVQSLEHQALLQQELREHMTQYYHLVLALQHARQLAETQHVQLEKEADKHIQVQAVSHKQILANLHLTQGRPQIFPEVGRPLWDFFPWGVNIAESFATWIQTMTWNTDEVLPACCRDGISWLELALSFSHHIGAVLPITRDNRDGEKQLVMISCYDDLDTYHVTYTDLAATMRNMWQHFVHMIPDRDKPPQSGGLNRKPNVTSSSTADSGEVNVSDMMLGVGCIAQSSRGVWPLDGDGGDDCNA